MKRLGNLFIALFILAACSVAAGSDARQSFDQLKTLEGNWAGKGSEGQDVKISMRMTAGGSALLHETHGEGPENMITIIHMDGDRLLLTHYCGVGNQPRMKLMASDATSLTFEFFDGTNIASGAGHMQRVVFSQPDANHHVEEWIFLDKGKEHKEVFTLERAKSGN